MDFKDYLMDLENRDIRAKPSSFDVGQANLALFTDLYELKMLQAYLEEGMTEDAVFSLFVRRMPGSRNFLLACGLETVLDYLENLFFTDEEIRFLGSLGYFSDSFLAWLRDFAFRGDVYAMPEGTPLFPNEPILEVKAPLPEAQLVETFILNQIHMQTLLASKAQRVVTAAEGRPVIDFGARRMHGIDTALMGARAFYIAGVAATSNVLAGRLYGVPVAGTMAHSYIQAHEDEASAFRSFAQLYPDTILLVDTYDTLTGVRNVIDLAKSLGKSFQVNAVRLDSGDLLTLSKEARRLLDDANLNKVRIFASGGLDEYAIAELLSSGAPIDGFGVGTHMGVSSDAPDVDIAYKLCEYAGKGRLKLSIGKPVLPGRKQVFRIPEGDRDMRDIIALADEDLPGRPLLSAVMRNGRRLSEDIVSLESSREYAREQISRLPDRIRAIAPAEYPYPVELSQSISRLQEETSEKVVR
jgi:nicotinate phosphoribosyltransferase